MGELHLSGRRRLRGFDYIGRHTYHVATVTHLRQPLLVDAVAAHTTAQIRSAADHTNFELLAFVIMPDHLHILAQGRADDANLVRLIQRFKQTTGYAYNRQSGQQLWQWSFYDRIVRKDEDVEAIAWYIVRNPERAGLTADSPWPYAGGSLLEAVSAQDQRRSGAKSLPLLASGAGRRGAS